MQIMERLQHSGMPVGDAGEVSLHLRCHIATSTSASTSASISCKSQFTSTDFSTSIADASERVYIYHE